MRHNIGFVQDLTVVIVMELLREAAKNKISFFSGPASFQRGWQLRNNMATNLVGGEPLLKNDFDFYLESSKK